MDPKLFALTLDLQRNAQSMTQTDNLPMRFSALDLLDYLGNKIDAKRKPTQEKAETL